MPGDRPKLLQKKRIPLLITEASDEFEAFRAKIVRDIKPQNDIERIYCDEFICLCWDILQWRRWKVAILNLAFADALYEVLVRKLGEFEQGQETVHQLEGWFTDEDVKRDISAILEKYGLDESAIEAEAFRQCANELALIEQLLAATEARRTRAIQQLALCREKLARALRDVAIDVTPRERPPLGMRNSSAG